jgi:hypothetical protein
MIQISFYPNGRKLESIIGIQGVNQTNTNYGKEFFNSIKDKRFGLFGTGTL